MPHAFRFKLICIAALGSFARETICGHGIKLQLRNEFLGLQNQDLLCERAVEARFYHYDPTKQKWGGA